MEPKKALLEKIEIPEGITIRIDGGIVTAKGPKNETKKTLLSPGIELKVEGSRVMISSKKKIKAGKEADWHFQGAHKEYV